MLLHAIIWAILICHFLKDNMMKIKKGMMIMNYSIKILDNKGTLIGKKIDATPTEVLTFIAKGFTVIDIHTGQQIQEQMITESVGISDGVCEY